MNRKTFFAVALATTALAATAALAQPPQAAEADFAGPGARLMTPPRAGAEQALQQLTQRWQGQSGELPRGFPFAVGDVADLAQAHIGYGFQVYDADAQSLLGGDSVAHSAHATGVWRFAVVLGERPVGLLTVAHTDHGWDMVSVGGAGLSQDIAAVVLAHGAQAGKQLRYVRVPQATADFIEVSGGGAEAGFVPLEAARQSLRLGGATPLAERDLQPLLRDAVARNLAN